MTSAPETAQARYLELCRFIGRLEEALAGLERIGLLSLEADTEYGAHVVMTYQAARAGLEDHFGRDGLVVDEASDLSASGAQIGPQEGPSSPATARLGAPEA